MGTSGGQPAARGTRNPTTADEEIRAPRIDGHVAAPDRASEYPPEHASKSCRQGLIVTGPGICPANPAAEHSPHG